MELSAILTLIIIAGAIILFVTEVVSVDLVALMIIVALVTTGVVSPKEGVEGFSNNATITVAFMFVLSGALLKTGALQLIAFRLSGLFRKNFMLGLVLMMLLVALISAFVNNTPVVAVFIPVVIQIARSAGFPPSKILIPLSFATIFGGTCTLIGTSTNILVSGIMEKEGLPGMNMFLMAPLGLVFLGAGILYMVVVGVRLLPARNAEKDLRKKFSMRDYLMEVGIPEGSNLIGKQILECGLFSELEIDILSIKRGTQVYSVPPGDFILHRDDLLNIRCNAEKIRGLKDRSLMQSQIAIGDTDLSARNATLVELMITANSRFEGKTLRELDFRRRYRGVPLAIQHREEIVHENLYDVSLRPGDILLAEIKSHFLPDLQDDENGRSPDFVLLSEDEVQDFKPKRFWATILIVMAVIVLATTGTLDIMIGTIAATCLLVLMKLINMKDVYQSINWNIIFLLAGALTLGTAMQNSGLDIIIAEGLVNNLGAMGPMAIISGLYLISSILTEIMSNNATAALLAPIAISTANQLDLSVIPFVMAVTFAASASFSTPVGYQTNTIVYSAGNYKFRDFLKVGIWLNLFFWLLATFLIPIIYPF